MTDRGETVGELSANMLAKDLWVAFSTAVAPIEDIVKLLPEHLKLMIELEKQGVLFASGPLLADDGTVGGDGITVIRAEGRDQAEEIARSDPLVEAGLRTVEVSRWRIMEGRVGFILDFSDRSYSVE